MDDQTKGAWIIHHGQKLKTDVHGAAEFPQIDTAAKAGSLFSHMAKGQQFVISRDIVNAYAQSSGMNVRTELPAILDLLKKQRLISYKSADAEVEVIGATTQRALKAATEIFDEIEPKPEEVAALRVAEMTSNAPEMAPVVEEYIGDNFKFSKSRAHDFLLRADTIGFVDSEGKDGDRILFNGYLFREAGPTKINKVLTTMNAQERARLNEFSERLSAAGCVLFQDAEAELGTQLFAKIRAIGLLDISYVENENGSTGFVTKPGAFHKFVNPLVDDAFDLAKALVAALSYGINRSAATRGRIWGVDLLLNKLIRGEPVGPAPAIGQDYKYLEERGVVSVYHDRHAFSMRLRQLEIGQIALQVLTKGDAAGTQLLRSLPSAPMSGYKNPESARSDFRRTDRGRLKTTDRDVLHVLRTKGAF